VISLSSGQWQLSAIYRGGRMLFPHCLIGLPPGRPER
jgi:hypothetical protein